MDIRRKIKPTTKIIKKWMGTFAVILLLSAVVYIAMTVQSFMALTESSSREISGLVDIVASAYVGGTESEKEIITSRLDRMQNKCMMILDIISSNINDVESMDNTAKQEFIAYLQQLVDASKIKEIRVTDSNGKVLLSGDLKELGKDLDELYPGYNEVVEMDQNSVVSGKQSQTIAGASADGSLYPFSLSTDELNYILPLSDTASNGLDNLFLVISYDKDTWKENIYSGFNRGIIIETYKDDPLNSGELMVVDMDSNQIVDCTDSSIPEGTLVEESSEKNKSDNIITYSKTGKEQTSETGGCWCNIKLLDGKQSSVYLREITSLDGDSLAVIGWVDNIDTSKSVTSEIGVFILVNLILMLVFVTVTFVISMYCESIVGIVKTRRTLAVQVGALLMVGLCIFSVFAVFFVSIADLTVAVSDSKTASSQISSLLDNKELRLKTADKYYEESDVSMAAMLALEISNSKDLSEYDATMQQYFYRDNDGRYQHFTDSFGNNMVCYAGSELMKNGIINDSKMWLIGDMGYAIASSEADQWYYDINTCEKSAEFLNVLYNRTPYYYGYIYDNNGNAVGLKMAYPVSLYTYDDNGQTVYTSYRNYITNHDLKIEKIHGVIIVESTAVPEAISMSEIKTDGDIELVLKVIDGDFARYIKTDQGAYNSVAIYNSPESKLDLNSIPIPDSSASQQVLSYFRTVSGVASLITTEHSLNSNIYNIIVKSLKSVHKLRVGIVKLYIVDVVVAYLLFEAYILLTKTKIISEGKETKHHKNGNSLELLGMQRLAQDKKRAIILNVAIILGMYLVGQDLFMNEGTFNLLESIYSDAWERSFSKYNIFGALALNIWILLLFSLIKKMSDYLSRPFGAKIQTICRLIVSLVQYIMLFLGVFYGAYIVGMDIRNVGTLATVVGGAIVLGSQKIVTDIVSGFVLVADGRFVINDYIRISQPNFEGKIIDLGIKNTTIRSDTGDVVTISTGNLSSAILLKRDDASPKENEAEPTDGNNLKA